MNYVTTWKNLGKSWYTGNMIKIYTTSTCAYCHALMDWLDDMGVEYEEMDATKHPEITTVPVTEVNGERIVGFDRPAIKKALKKLAA
jgi:glutaredoxin